MSDVLNKWSIYCTTESAYVYIWLSETASTPTTCPNNTAHSINSALTRIVESRKPSSVQIAQEATSTGGNYRWDSVEFDALADSTTTYTFSYPIPITVLSATWQTGEENRGDIVSWHINKNTIIGAITSSVAIGDTVINVSSTVTANMKVGFMINLYDGVNTDDMGFITAIDAIAGTITMSIATTHAFSPATPTYVRFSVPFLDKVELGHPCRMQIGEVKIMGSYVPKNTVVTCTYVNNSSVDKHIVAYMEFLY